MKVCPECGTQYEDHVPTCIADGATLVARTPTAVVSLPPSKPRVAPAQRPPPSRLPLVLLVLTVIATATLVSVVVLAVASSRLALVSSAPPPEPPRPRPPPPRLEPEPIEPIEKPPVEVVLVSEPLGAKVYENDQFVCVTPCTIKHPPHAPLPRVFVFKAEGYRDDLYEMTEAKGPIAVALHHVRSSPVPSAPSSAAPRPTIGRDR